MGLTSEILLHFPEEGKHLTGKKLTGIVRFQLDKETVFKKISLSFVEKGYCSWYDETESRQSEKDLLEGHEDVAITKIYFLNKEVDDNLTLSAGSYEYPFEIEIPENIPSSFKTEIGKIKYYLILKFKKPGILKRDKSIKTEIEIYPQVDPSITDEPLSFALDKKLTKMLSSNNHEIRVIGDLEKQYLSYYNENKISFAVTNNTDINFNIKTELMYKTKYKHDYSIGIYGDDKIKKGVIDYCTCQTPIVPDNSVSNIYSVLPPVDPQEYTVRHSQIISREYKLRVTLQLPIPHRNVSVDVPVFIGERRLVKENDNEGRPDEPPTYLHAITEKN